MSLETITQTEVKDPTYSKIADAILVITNGGREQCHDQETIRVMLHTFAQASATTGNSNGAGVLGCGAKRHY
jgi:hypothetical protein